MSALWVTLALLLIVLGALGIVVPGLPGTLLILAGLVWLAWLDDFTHVGGGTIIAWVLLTAASYAVDLVVTALGAKHVGASRRAIMGAFLGSIVGLFFGLAGIVLGPFVGAFAGELTTRGRVSDATRVGFGTWLGLVVGLALKLSLMFMMLGIGVAAFMLT